LFQLINTDGYADIFKYQVVSFNFAAHYRNAFGIDTQYVIGYLDSSAIERYSTIKNFVVIPDTTKKPLEPAFIVPGKSIIKKQKLESYRTFRIDTATQTGFLAVNTFSEGKLNKFFRKSFKTIQEQRVKNLVVDLRLNSGGDVLTSINLVEYLVDKPFKVADTVAATTRRFVMKRYVKPWFIYWLSMQFTGRKSEDDRIHFRYFEKHYFKPRKKNHFNGTVYLLTGGYTFSAGSMVTGKLKGQKNVTIVGEETGGGYYGNTAMFLTTIKLPHTGIRVTLPLYRMVLNNVQKTGRGVFPDIEAGPVSTLIKAGIDPKMEKVLELIRSNK
jgi:C-terminal processing protease CtpA/Prc